jgi:hypothetical protein
MADINDINAAQTIKIVGSSSDGTEQTPVQSTIDGSIHNKTDPRPLKNVIYNCHNLLNGSSKFMNVNGSAGSPINFEFLPSGSDIWFLDSIVLFLMDPGSMDYDDFGAISGSLTNGLRIVVRSNGVEYEIANIKDNTELVSYFLDSTSFGKDSSGILDDDDSYVGAMHFKNPIRLDASQGDYVRIQVRDNLNNLTSLQSSIKIWRIIS